MHAARTRRISRWLLVSACTLAASGGSAATAQALTRVYDGADYATVGTERLWLEVCDGERDRHRVYGDFSGPGWKQRITDTNGTGGGCGNWVAPFPAWIQKFRVCESLPKRRDRCSSWVQFLD